MKCSCKDAASTWAGMGQTPGTGDSVNTHRPPTACLALPARARGPSLEDHLQLLLLHQCQLRPHQLHERGQRVAGEAEVRGTSSGTWPAGGAREGGNASGDRCPHAVNPPYVTLPCFLSHVATIWCSDTKVRSSVFVPGGRAVCATHTPVIALLVANVFNGGGVITARGAS